jgi:hypothetical protein
MTGCRKTSSCTGGRRAEGGRFLRSDNPEQRVSDQGFTRARSMPRAPKAAAPGFRRAGRGLAAGVMRRPAWGEAFCSRFEVAGLPADKGVAESEIGGRPESLELSQQTPWDAGRLGDAAVVCGGLRDHGSCRVSPVGEGFKFFPVRLVVADAPPVGDDCRCRLGAH